MIKIIENIFSCSTKTTRNQNIPYYLKFKIKLGKTYFY